jgi:hypothetical protein
LYGGPTGDGVIINFTDSQGFYWFNDLPPGRYAVDVVYPTCTRLLSSITGVDLIADDTSSNTESNVYRKRGDVCEELSPGDQHIGVMIFESLDECCANMFWFDMDGCMSRSQDATPSFDVPRFFPTWIGGQLCNSKHSFESWEESYLTLKECCEAHFLWEYSACCASSDMGGC